MSSRQAATFRLAWRFVRGSRGRSLLIALLVAIPVMAGAFAAVTIRTAHLSPSEAATRQLGKADAIAVVPGGSRHLDRWVHVGRSNSGDTMSNVPYQGRHTPTDTEWSRALPAGSRVTPDAWARTINVATGDRAEAEQGVALDLADPMTRGIYRIRSGLAPASSGEAALTNALAKRLHVRVGGTVRLDGQTVRISAIVENPNSLDESSVVAPAQTLGGLSGATPGGWYGNLGYWLIDTPGAAPDLHDRVLAEGIVYETRAQWEHPGPDLTSSRTVDGQVIIVLATVAGFGLLEVLLLAGAAFAVGTRRQTRQLGLLAASGGDDDDIRRTVLAQGALLGVGGAIIGAAAGVLAVVLFRGLLEMAADKRFGVLDVAASDLVAVAVLGVVAGLLAAIVPARAAAARPVLQMLRDRYEADGRLTAIPRWSLIAISGGSVIIVVAAFRWHAGAGDLHSTFVTTGSVSAVAHGLATMLRENGWPAVLWFGAVLTLAGLVRACPAIVARLASRSGGLPVSPRLALRDAGRHRQRTGPAVAAVMTVVAGAVLVLFVASSSDLRDKREFRPALPIGVIGVNPAGAPQPAGQTLSEVVGRTTVLVGGGTQVVIGQAGKHGQATVQAPNCQGEGAADLAACQYFGLGVASSDAIDLIAGHPVPAADHALADGRAVVLAPLLVDHGTVQVHTGQARPDATTTRLRAVAIRGLPQYGELPQVYVSPATAAAHGWQTHDLLGLVKPTHIPSVAVMDKAQAALGGDVYINIERGFHSRYSVVLLAMLGAAAIATLAGTSIAVALAMAESRADMATMAAVGASPVRRRVHAMGQAATVAGLGTGLGVALGVLVAVATLGGSSVYPTSTPYLWLVAVLLVAPALAIVVAGAVTRSRVPLTRRIA